MATIIPNPGRGKDNRADMGISRDACREIGEALSKAFVWVETAEGHAFWVAIRDRMFELANAPASDKPPPPRLPDPPARPSSQAAPCDVRDWMDSADGIDVERHDAHEHHAPEWSLYLLCPFGVRREWIADYEIGTNDDQYTAEEAEALAYDYAERLLEAFPQLRAHGINPKE